jgi:hypothetical protein
LLLASLDLEPGSPQPEQVTVTNVGRFDDARAVFQVGAVAAAEIDEAQLILTRES